jgi:hypothetical protein
MLLRRVLFLGCLVASAFLGGMAADVSAHPAGHHAPLVQHAGEILGENAPTLHDFRAEGASHSLLEMVLIASPGLSSALDCQCWLCDDGFCAGPAAVEPSDDSIPQVQRFTGVGLSDISPPRRTHSAIENPPKSFA